MPGASLVLTGPMSAIVAVTSAVAPRWYETCGEKVYEHILLLQKARLRRVERSTAMQLKEVMTPGVEVISPEASIREAAEKMRHLDIGPLPVCDGDRLVGMLTDRDITIRAVADGRDPVTTPVREVMTSDIVYGFDDQDIQDATRLMEQYQIRRLPVLNRNKRLVGIVSLGDLAVHPGNQPLASEVLEQVSEPGKSGRK
jgi:CBS domain-containing protein